LLQPQYVHYTPHNYPQTLQYRLRILPGYFHGICRFLVSAVDPACKHSATRTASLWNTSRICMSELGSGSAQAPSLLMPPDLLPLPHLPGNEKLNCAEVALHSSTVRARQVRVTRRHICMMELSWCRMRRTGAN